MASTVLPSHAGGHAHAHHHGGSHHSCSAASGHQQSHIDGTGLSSLTGLGLSAQADLSMLALLTSTSPHPHGRDRLPSTSQRKRQVDRRPQLDPLILETAAASGPQVTRNHYLHEFFPHSTPYHRCDIDGKHCEPVKAESSKPRYTSLQAPRRQRLAEAATASRQPGRQDEPEPVADNRRSPPPPPIRASNPRRLSSAQSQDPSVVVPLLRSSESPSKRFSALPPATSPSHSKQALPAPTKPARLAPLHVVCHARTRIPTPHGPVFLHLYRNNRDDKEHLAFVVDRDQLEAAPGEASSSGASVSWLRSRSLDAEWRSGETEMERIVRGAYVGRLGSGAGQAVASTPRPSSSANDGDAAGAYVPIVRIHSECFTGETLGSQRCDCGEQLDEALRLISSNPPYRGVVVYLRQEGRGIGLLSKLRAYNLQDLGHDTVTANLLLGHAADSRSYEVAAGVLRDLGVQKLNLLTNNPDKVESVEREGLAVVERVGMVPRQWTLASSGRRSRHHDRRSREKRALRGIRHQGESPEGDGPLPGDDADAEDGGHNASPDDSDSGQSDESAEEADDSEVEALKRRAGVGMIGGGTTRSAELDKYLRTKVERMRHLITLPPESDTDDLSHRSGAASPSPLTQPPSRVGSGLGLASLRARLRPLAPSRRPARSRTLTQEDAPSAGATSGSDGLGHALERSSASLRTDPEGLSLGTDASDEPSSDGVH